MLQHNRAIRLRKYQVVSSRSVVNTSEVQEKLHVLLPKAQISSHVKYLTAGQGCNLYTSIVKAGQFSEVQGDFEFLILTSIPNSMHI